MITTQARQEGVFMEAVRGRAGDPPAPPQSGAHGALPQRHRESRAGMLQGHCPRSEADRVRSGDGGGLTRYVAYRDCHFAGSG